MLKVKSSFGRILLLTFNFQLSTFNFLLLPLAFPFLFAGCSFEKKFLGDYEGNETMTLSVGGTQSVERKITERLELNKKNYQGYTVIKDSFSNNHIFSHNLVTSNYNSGTRETQEIFKDNNALLDTYFPYPPLRNGMPTPLPLTQKNVLLSLTNEKILGLTEPLPFFKLTRYTKN